jgi:pyrroloquinoline-quinone synthase
VGPLAGTYLDRLDALIKKYNLLNHPFYEAWSRGELSRTDLQRYAKDYFHHVLAFPTYVSGVHSRISDLRDRQTMLENLMEEEHGPENHPELWLRFAEGIGASRSAVTEHVPSSAVASFVRAFQRATRNANPLVGLSALYAYESQVPSVAHEKIAGLKKFFGVKDARTLQFFDVHEAADVEHSQDERRLIERYAKNGDHEIALKETEKVLKGVWRVLSTVYSGKGRMAS